MPEMIFGFIEKKKGRISQAFNVCFSEMEIRREI